MTLKIHADLIFYQRRDWQNINKFTKILVLRQRRRTTIWSNLESHLKSYNVFMWKDILTSINVFCIWRMKANLYFKAVWGTWQIMVVWLGQKASHVQLYQTWHLRFCGVYCSSSLTVVDDEAPRHHGCAIHFYHYRNAPVICVNKDLNRTSSTCQSYENLEIK